MNAINSSANNLQAIIASAQSLGLEIDEAKAQEWLDQAATGAGEEEITVDMERGTFGLRSVMLDYSPKELARLRQIGELIELTGPPGVVETALSISGSAAQSAIQSYPGDADFFERVNIHAETLDEAKRLYTDLFRQTAFRTLRGERHQLINVKFGAYPQDVIHRGNLEKAGAPIDWVPGEIEAGRIQAQTPDGEPATITWEEIANNPGWCMMDWVVVDPLRGKLIAVSNMFDVTWEAPDGRITPLDGHLDPYFQEVYLQPEALPVFSKLIQHLAPGAIDEYVRQLQREVRKYTTAGHLNYGKVAKRLYNIFRLTGRYVEAALLREMFDEPAGALYQIWSLVKTVEESCLPGSAIRMENVRAQVDEMVVNAFLVLHEATSGAPERDILRRLVRLREILEQEVTCDDLYDDARAVSAELIEVVNQYFFQRLDKLPGVRYYLGGLTEAN